MNDARLGKIYSSLSARELARLKLQLFKNGQPEDLRFQSATSGAQAYEYWQLIGLLRATDGELGWYLLHLRERVRVIQQRWAMVAVFHWALQMESLSLFAEFGMTPRSASMGKAHDGLLALLRRGPVLPFGGEPPLDASQMTEMVRRIMESVATLVRQAWADLLAVDDTLSRIAERFDGEEPLHPELRELLDETRAVLMEIHEGLAQDGPALDLPVTPAERTRDALLAIIAREAKR